MNESIKVIAVGVIAFFLGSTFIQGRQSLEVVSLNQKISSLEKQLSDKENQLKTAQTKAQKQQQLVKEFLQKLEQSK